MLWNYLTLLQEIQWEDLLDIFFASILIGIVIHVLRSSRTRAVSIGLLFFAGIFITANQLELKLTIWMLQGITAVSVLIVVVVYQAEIRRFLERLPQRLLLHKIQKKKFHSGVTDIISEAVMLLSAEGHGALIVLPGRDSLEGVITGGIKLNGHLSKALILSIFDPNSPGHDGALIVMDDRVELFGVRLPLSNQVDKLRDRGTRHAAALGLAEQTDALVLIVSEETSMVSIAVGGTLRAIPEPAEITSIIDSHLKQKTDSTEEDNDQLVSVSWGYSFDVVAALLIAVTLWLILVPGSVVGKMTYEIPIEIQNIPEGFELVEVVPSSVFVTLSGERRHLFQSKSRQLGVRLDGTLTRFGRQTFPINNTHLLLPPEVEIDAIDPEEVRVLVKAIGIH
jgi:diadenylate cyclase